MYTTTSKCWQQNKHDMFQMSFTVSFWWQKNSFLSKGSMWSELKSCIVAYASLNPRHQMTKRFIMYIQKWTISMFRTERHGKIKDWIASYTSCFLVWFDLRLTIQDRLIVLRLYFSNRYYYYSALALIWGRYSLIFLL